MPNLSTSSILQMVFRLRFSFPLRMRDTYCCVQPKRAARSACDMPSASSLSSIMRAMRRDSRRHASFPLLSSAFSCQRLGVADGNCSNFFTIFSFIADGFMIVILAGLQGKSLYRILAAPSRRLLLFFIQTFIGRKSGQESGENQGFLWASSMGKPLVLHPDFQ